MRFITNAVLFQFLFFFALSVSASAYDIDYVTYKAPNEKTSIVVFTDTSCGFCRKLHDEIPDLNASGITVKYLPYPRKGIKSKSAKKLASIYCSDNPQRQMTKAKAGFVIPAKVCENPVKPVFEKAYADKIVRGTPAIYTSDGSKQLGGYISAQQATEKLNLKYVPASVEDKLAFQAIRYQKQSMEPTYYLVEKRMSWRTQPSEEVKGGGSLGQGGIMVATHFADVDGVTWVGKTHKNRDFYFNGNNLKKISEVREFDVNKLPKQKYVTNAATSVYLVPNVNAVSVKDFRRNTLIKPTFDYQEGGVKWLGYERKGIKYFMLAELLDEKVE